LPLNTGTATAWSTTAKDIAKIKQFLTDFGYTSTDFSNATTGPPLNGIFGATTTTGSQNWPWPKDSGSTLGTYLTSKVYVPGSTTTKLTTTTVIYQQIMRLYNWNYVIDNLGTTPCDWRARFFGTTDNTALFTSSGTLDTPQHGPYTINYNEILRWLTQSNNPFPTQMRAGRIKYYGTIPTAITGRWPSYGGTDQQFWVEFIDHVLGFRQTSSLVYQDISAMAGYGSDYTWGTIGINVAPGSTSQYMNYSDNPFRGKLRWWLSPILMVDYLQNYNMENVSGYYYKQPGNANEAPLYTAKQAFLAAIDTMQTDHPNDWVTVVPYSWPRSSSNGTASGSGSYGRFNCVRSPLGPNYGYATSALLFPFSTINADGTANNTEITPYDADQANGLIPSANLVDTPRSDGDTCFAMSLMLCYNQFAVTPVADSTLRTFVTNSPITFPTGMAGGLGRKGAQKVIIFETDGLANCTASATLNTSGAYSYYPIRYDRNNPGRSEYPAVTTYSNLNDPNVISQVKTLVTQLQTTYGTARNPFRLYAIGFGPVFASGAPDAAEALSTLQSMQYWSGTQSSASTALPSNQIITGTDAQMSANMISSYTSILQNGVQIALIK
jgi:hypothetical protein